MTKNHSHVIYNPDCDVCAKGYFEARRIAEGQVWTTEYPTEPGYYWLRKYVFWKRDFTGPDIVEVDSDLDVLFPGDDDSYALSKFTSAEWLGPIHPPEDKPSRNLTQLFHDSLTNRGKQVLTSQTVDSLERQDKLSSTTVPANSLNVGAVIPLTPQQDGDCWVDNDGIVAHAGGCIGDKCSLGPGSVIL